MPKDQFTERLLHPLEVDAATGEVRIIKTTAGFITKTNLLSSPIESEKQVRDSSVRPRWISLKYYEPSKRTLLADGNLVLISMRELNAWWRLNQVNAEVRDLTRDHLLQLLQQENFVLLLKEFDTELAGIESDEAIDSLCERLKKMHH